MVRPANAQLEQKHAVGVVYLFTLTVEGWLRKMNMDEHCSGMEYIYWNQRLKRHEQNGSMEKENTATL